MWSLIGVDELSASEPLFYYSALGQIRLEPGPHRAGYNPAMLSLLGLEALTADWLGDFVTGLSEAPWARPMAISAGPHQFSPIWMGHVDAALTRACPA